MDGLKILFKSSPILKHSIASARQGLVARMLITLSLSATNKKVFPRVVLIFCTF